MHMLGVTRRRQQKAIFGRTFRISTAFAPHFNAEATLDNSH